MTANGTNDAPLRFLIVDDDDDIREVLVLIVEHLGHAADSVGDGAQALEALATNRYDFMLLDLTMPRMTGQDVLRWLRDHPERAADLRVVVVSAWAHDQHEALKMLGAHAVLTKPLRAQQLRELVAESRSETGT